MHHHFNLGAFARTTRIALFVVAMLAITACGPGQPPTPNPENEALQAYLSAIQAFEKDFAENSSALQGLYEEVIEHPSLFDVPEWNASVTIGRVGLISAVARVRALDSPPGLERAHQELLLAADAVENLSALINQADLEDRLDMKPVAEQAIRDAMQHFEEGHSLIDAARNQ